VTSSKLPEINLPKLQCFENVHQKYL
jgi:hypothetical protein